MLDILETAIRNLVKDLAAGNYERITSDGCNSRLSIQELSVAISEYGRVLTSLPEDAFKIIDCYPLKGVRNEWAIDVPLWTKEEGRSDLTLSLTAKVINKHVIIEIDDLHVM